MADKQVKIEVQTEAKLQEVQALEEKIRQIKREKIQLDIEANTAKLENTEHRIQSLKTFLDTVNTGNTNIHIDDSEIKKAEEELDKLESEKIDLEIAIESGKLDSVKSEIDSLDGSSIDVDVNNISAMDAIGQIGDGIDRLKSGASELGQNIGNVLESAGRMEQTNAFLSMNLGADVAKQKLEEIRSVTDKLPGDDVTLQNLLSQAALKDANMTTEAFTQMGSAAADYMAAMQNFGKSSTETQQDLMNYILAGNTAEIERSPILQSHIDKLKEGTTVQERAKLLQEALNEEGWAGIASQDIYNNKFQQFNDMLERGKMNLGAMFQEGAKDAMDMAMQLDESTNGLLGMSLALGEMVAGPLVGMMSGIAQIGMGLKTLGEADELLGLRDKLKDLKTNVLDLASNIKGNLKSAFDTLKTTMSGLKTTLLEVASTLKANLMSAWSSFTGYMSSTVIPAIKNAVLALKEMAINVLRAGYNALKSAAMWVAEKAAVVASTLAEYALAAAQAVLNAVMSMNPIMLVVIALIALAAALIWAYNNVDWFREMVDNAWSALQGFAGWLAGEFMGAINGVGDAFNNAGQMLQDAFTGAVEYVQGILQGLYDYIMTLGGLIPEGVSITGNQIVDSILAVMGFIATLPLQLAMIFVNLIAQALGFGTNFSQRMINTAVQSVTGFITYIATLPGRVASYLSSILSNVISWGSSIASNFLSAASKSVSNFANQISQIPAKLGAELSNALDKVNEWAATLPAKFWEAGVNAVKNFLSALGIGSPGTMQRTLVWEVSEMGRRVPIESKSLLSNISSLGEDVVSEFGNPKLGVDFDKTMNSQLGRLGDGSLGHTTVNLNLEVGSVDSDDRVLEIVEAVRKELNWNNLTAGRTI